MSKPTPFRRSFNYQPLQPTNVPEVGARLNAEFDALVVTLAEMRANLALIQRDDGKLANGSVELDALSSTLKLALAGAWTPRGTWTMGASYLLRDIVTFAGVAYVAVRDHVGGVFATDLANNLWLPLTTAGAAEVQAATTALNAALATVQTALDTINSGQDDASQAVEAAQNAAAVASAAAATVANQLIGYIAALTPQPTTTPEAYFVGAGPFDLGDFSPSAAPYANERIPAVRIDLSQGLGSTIDLGTFP